MKNTSAYLGILAIIISTSVAIASSKLHHITAYQFIDNPGTENDECLEVEAPCDLFGQYSCRVSAVSPTLRQTSLVATHCGPEQFCLTSGCH